MIPKGALPPWPGYPAIYEINTWVWLAELGRKHGRPVDLGTVPPAEWDALASHGLDAIWFMGVWERSPAGIAISMQDERNLAAFRKALPDFTAADNVGSPYCVRGYAVDKHLGGPKGLAAARRMLRERGLRLILDFVPNHLAHDHPWVRAHPDYFVHGSEDDVRHDPGSFVNVGGAVFACGRDPFFPAWQDVLQVNAFHPGLRQAATETIAGIAGQCDGIRCDMAMLMINDIFARTWGARAGVAPADDYWRMVIPAVKAAHPEFLFIAEAYWDLEWELQQQGFDFCYDKKLYDRLEHGDAEPVRQHLLADQRYQDRMLRFIENHDEPRAAEAFSSSGHARAAAVAVLTLPGARLLHQGQAGGARVRLPVFLARRPAEPIDRDQVAFYERLLTATSAGVFRNGAWRLCERSGWPDNDSFRTVLSWCWAAADERWLVVTHFGPDTAQARVHVPWDELRDGTWRLEDALSGEVYDRGGAEMRDSGLYVDLGPWHCHLFRVTRL